MAVTENNIKNEEVSKTEIRLCALERDDIDFLMKWENDEDVWKYSDTIAPLSRRILEKYLESYDADPFSAGQLRLMIRLTEADNCPTCGIVDLYDISAINAHASVGIFITPECRKQGIGKAALSQLENYCRKVLGLRSLLAKIEESNTASTRLFSSAGYTLRGAIPGWIRNTFEWETLTLWTINLKEC